MYALIRQSKGSSPVDKIKKLDIDLCDESGKVCVRMNGFSAKSQATEPESTGTLILRHSWKKETINEDAIPQDYEKYIIALCEPEESSRKNIESKIKNAEFIFLKSEDKNIANRFGTYALQLFEKIQEILKEKPKGRILFQVLFFGKEEQQLFSGFSGLLKTASLENPKFTGQLIEIYENQDVHTILNENSKKPDNIHIKYKNRKRFVTSLEEIKDLPSEPDIVWKENGVYLITGGAGGLGLIFAREICKKVKNPVLILTGRSELNESKKTHIEELKNTGSRIEYKQADVSQKQDVINLINFIKQEFGNLNGIIHSAGIIKDNFIIKKTKDEFEKVLAPKVSGLTNLDEASKDFKLDFFVVFSSGSGVFGNAGQADYACANAFMDAYAEYRNDLVRSEKRSGKTLAIDWPLWKEGGMQIDKETEKMMRQSTGMTAMKTQTGIDAFYKGLSLSEFRIIVAEGMPALMRLKLIDDKPDRNIELPVTEFEVDSSLLFNKIKQMLIKNISDLLKVKSGDIDIEVEFNEYGFDSISLTQFANILNEKYKLELSPTLFFEYSTISHFAKYLNDEHKSIFASEFAMKTELKVSESFKDESEIKPELKNRRSRFTTSLSAPKSETIETEPVAIIGISGKFPMAEDIDEFWKNLVEGKNCITEIPGDRWDWKKYYGDPLKEKNKTNIKWGGFIDGIGDFDPLFFGISPREAELMDPQQRLMMIYVWKAIEDAGINIIKLSQKPTGVFISPGVNEYINMTSVNTNDPFILTGAALSSIPNRISYALNLNGPSEYCETACSSALVALHRAIAAIHAGECEQAIIGAVNLILSPTGFISFESKGYLSPEGKARSFQSGADGYVRSEGVGAIIIKPLYKAINNNDRIYAVIKGTGVSHGGKGMSLTAPTGKGMKNAMKQAYQTSRIDPRTITYIEAH